MKGRIIPLIGIALILISAILPSLNASIISDTWYGVLGLVGIIKITNANHLNSDRVVISDIYPEVKNLDGIWSETIPSGDYVRVVFEKNLTKKNDITIYPKTISGNPSVEVYEANKNILIENFTSINDNQYNKVYLTKLLNNQNTFDLHVVGGSLQFDEITDPSISTYFFNGATVTGNMSNQSLSSSNGSARAIWTGTASNQVINFISPSFGNDTNVSRNFAVTFWCARTGTTSGTVLQVPYYRVFDCSTSTCSSKIQICASPAVNLNCYNSVATLRTSSACSNSTGWTIPAGHYLAAQIQFNTSNTRYIVLSYNNTTYFSNINFTSVIIDTTSPTITLPVYTNATQYQTSDNLTFNISVTDSGVGPDSCTINVGGNTNQTVKVSSSWCNGTYSLTGISGGNQTINAYANDTYGNLGLNDSYVVDISSDTTPPNVTINIPKNTTYHRVDDFPLTFNISLSEPGSVMYSIDNGTDNVIGNTSMDTLDNKNFNSTLDDLSPDNYTFTVYANDTAGNNNYTQKVNFQVIQQHVIVNGTIQDGDGNFINTTFAITVTSNSTVIYNNTDTTNNTATIPINSTYNLDIIPLDISTIDNVQFNNVNFSTLDNRTVSPVILDGRNNGTDGFDNIFAIGNNLNQNATITFTAQANSLYKCPNWDFTDQDCSDNNWTLFMRDLQIGHTYNFTMSPGDPGYGIINIIDAQHLDSNRTFISDIYPETRFLDNVWSETIPSGDYVRATFEQPLTSSNDITLYPRTVSGTPSVEVYEVNQSTLIANFTSLTDNKYNKIFLTNLSENQTTFDLHVTGGSIQLDQIVDPLTTLQIFPDGAGVAQNFTYIINSSNSWGAVNNSPVNTSEYVSSNTSTQNETFSFQNVTIPAGANITNITVYIYASANTANITRNQSSIFIISGADGSNGTTKTNFTVTNKTAAISNSVPNTSVYIANWSTNPTGPANWNQTTINGLQAGVRLPVSKFGGISLSQIYINVTYNTDTTAPYIVTLNLPANNYNTSNQTVMFNATGADNMNLSNLTLYSNFSGSWAANLSNLSPKNNTLTNFTVTGIPEGLYIWNVLACDSADNCAFNSTTNYTIIVDRTAPTIALPLYTNATNYKNTQSLTFNISVTNALSGPAYCVINVTGNANQTVAVSSGWCNGTYALTGLSDGNKTINAYANDTAGNVGLNNSYVVEMDSSAPTIVLNNPINNSNSITTSNTFSANLSDLNPINYTILYGNFSGSWAVNSTNTSVVNGTQVNFTIGLPDGVYIWNYWANDSLGNSGFFSSNRTLIVDTTPPTYSSNQTNDTVAGNSVNFSLLVNDNIALQSNGKYIFSTNNTGTWVNDSGFSTITSVQAANGTPSADVAGLNITAQFTTPVTAGDFILVATSWGGGSPSGFTISNVSDSLGNKYYDTGASNYSTDLDQSTGIWYANNTKSGSNDIVNVTYSSASALWKTVYIVEYSGVATSGAIDSASQNSSATGTPYPGRINVTTNGDAIIAVTSGNNQSETLATGFNVSYNDTTTPMLVINQTQTTAANITTFFTKPLTESWVASAVALKPASTSNTFFSSTPQWANITKTLNSTVGTLVGYRWYLTDNAGNVNNTGIYTLVTTSSAPANCWAIIGRQVYVPTGCVYYIPGGTQGYTG